MQERPQACATITPSPQSCDNAFISNKQTDQLVAVLLAATGYIAVLMLASSNNCSLKLGDAE
jgi:hypothetical protein